MRICLPIGCIGAVILWAAVDASAVSLFTLPQSVYANRATPHLTVKWLSQTLVFSHLGSRLVLLGGIWVAMAAAVFLNRNRRRRWQAGAVVVSIFLATHICVPYISELFLSERVSWNTKEFEGIARALDRANWEQVRGIGLPSGRLVFDAKKSNSRRHVFAFVPRRQYRFSEQCGYVIQHYPAENRMLFSLFNQANSQWVLQRKLHSVGLGESDSAETEWSLLRTPESWYGRKGDGTISDVESVMEGNN